MRVNALLISAAFVFGAPTDAALAQDVTAGEAAFRKCQVSRHRRGCTEQAWADPQWVGWSKGRHRRGLRLQRSKQELRDHLERGKLQGAHRGSSTQDPWK